MVIANRRMWRFTGKVCQSWPSATISCQSKCEEWTLLCRFDCQKIFEVILTWKVVQQDFWQTWKSASREEKAADFPWLDICNGFTIFFHFSTFALRDWHLHQVYNIIFNFWLNMNHLPRWFGLKYLALGMICWEDCFCLLRHRSRDQSSFLCVVRCIILDEDNGNIWV